MSILGRSKRTFDNYSRHVAAMALHFKTLPTELDPEQVKDYLYELQQRSQTPSQSYFKHTVYGLRFLLKTEGLPYNFLHLPAIPKVNKLPVILSREEIWRMLQTAELLKHKLLIGLIYGCGLRCMEVRNIELQHLDFDRKMLHIVQGKGQKDRYVPLSNTEFVRRFSLHILPRRFVRIRHYGILSSSWKRGKLQNLQSDLNIRIPEAKPKTLLNKCRCFKEGNLVTIALFGQRGPPQDFLFVTQPLSAK
ncbi:tyrosine-type recombinase/integrase [Chryseobacterium salivictor]|uniref:tyrosine-type recombinase/integrase n=1 Tax=Chryseobacterium salivictor TaxID=2547600 RepID=UPI003741F1F9